MKPGQERSRPLSPNLQARKLSISFKSGARMLPGPTPTQRWEKRPLEQTPGDAALRGHRKRRLTCQQIPWASISPPPRDCRQPLAPDCRPSPAPGLGRQDLPLPEMLSRPLPISSAKGRGQGRDTNEGRAPPCNPNKAAAPQRPDLHPQ